MRSDINTYVWTARYSAGNRLSHCPNDDAGEGWSIRKMEGFVIGFYQGVAFFAALATIAFVVILLKKREAE